MAVSKTKWFQTLLTPQTVIYIFAGMVAIILFWFRTQESWAKAAKVELRLDEKADKTEVKAVDEKVNKQYLSISELRQMITVLEKWVEYHKGYEQSRKDYNHTP